MNVLGVQAGNGVIVHPFKECLVGNLETRAIFHTKNNEQWVANFGNIPLYKTVEQARKGIKTPIDIIIGNPDCGHSSILSYSRKKALSDPKENKSLNLYIRAIKKYKPKVFLLENLPKLLDILDFDYWRATFKDYHFVYNISSVSAYGNSQTTRIRLVLIGVKVNNSNNIQYQFNNVYKVNQLKTTRELLAGLEEEKPQLGHVREPLDSIITLYAGFKISLEDVQRSWLENPESSRWQVRGRKFTTAPGVYRNLPDKYPSTARKANRQFNPSGLQMSPRELARIQGIPDEFIIYMNNDNQQYWINKGRASVTKCPPYEIGKWFYEQVKKSNQWEID